MFRRNEFPPSSRRSRRHVSVVVAALLTLTWLTGFGLVGPAGAEDEISVAPDHIVRAEEGTLTVVATEVVAPELIGKTCDFQVTAINGSSVHVGNALVVTTGDARIVVPGVEDNPDGSVVGAQQVTLGDTIVLELQMGPDGVSSLGFSAGFDCIPTPPPTVQPAQQEATTTTPAPTVLPAQQEATTTTAAVTELPEAAPARATAGRPSFTG